MKCLDCIIVCTFLSFLLVLYAGAQEEVNWDVAQQIRNEGFNKSYIMDDVGYMTDVFGPRLAKSPSYLESVQWLKGKLEEYGLKNVVLDPYEMGVGWRNDYTSVHMMTPQYMPVIAYPESWSSPTDGKVRGPVVYINFQEIESLSDLEQYRGKLKNAIIFSNPKQEMKLGWEPEAVVFTDEQLDRMAETPIFPPQPQVRRRDSGALAWRRIVDLLMVENIAAIVKTDNFHDDGTVRVTRISGTPWAPDAPPNPTSFVMAAEHYNRIMRVMEKGITVEMEVELRITLTDDDYNDYNVLADIPGTDPELKDQIVMLGAHYDAHSSSTGTEDNATGSAHALEAARILSAIGAQPRRTFRFAFWGGEEIGHLGSRAYVKKYLGNRDTQEYLPAHKKFSAYFNLDYGTGKIRGIFLMNNLSAKPIISEWIKPFHDIGLKHVVLIPGGDIGSDHAQFLAVGLPIFPFLQDPVENDSRTWHTNMDTFDRIVPEYLIQGAVVSAGMIYQAAMGDEMMPRLPVER
jgi:carboxypeptidase Q